MKEINAVFTRFTPFPSRNTSQMKYERNERNISLNRIDRERPIHQNERFFPTLNLFSKFY